MKVAPSILSANFLKLEEELVKVSQAGADLLHIDVMDGHFVPNLTFGPMIVEQIADATSLPLDIHLMVDRVPFFLELFRSVEAKIFRLPSRGRITHSSLYFFYSFKRNFSLSCS